MPGCWLLAWTWAVGALGGGCWRGPGQVGALGGEWSLACIECIDLSGFAAGGGGDTEVAVRGGIEGTDGPRGEQGEEGTARVGGPASWPSPPHP